MPKESSERIIDWPYVSPSRRGGSITIGGGGGGGGGASSFFDLTDVNPVGWDNGEVPTWNSASGMFEPTLPSGGGGGSYVEGNGIDIFANQISVQPNPIRGIIVDSSGVGVYSTIDTGLRADATRGLYIYTKTHSGLDIDSNGVSVGAGQGITVEGEEVQVKLAPGEAGGGVNAGLGFGGQGGLYIGAGDGITVLPDTIEVNAAALVGLGIEEDGDNNFKVKLAPGEASGGVNAGLGFGGQGGLYVGEGNGINVLPNTIEVKLTPGVSAGGVNAGLGFGGAGGLYVGEGDGIGVAEDSVNVRLSQPSSGLDFGSDGGLLVGEGDGIDVETNTIRVNVVEIINPAYGIYHDGSNNIVVALEPDSGLRYNDPSGRLELGEPGILSVTSVSELIDDTHFHQVLSSSDPGAARSLLATDLDGGLRLDTNLLYVDAANNRVGVNTVPENEWGAATLDVFAANPADHTQRIKQMVGQTGRMWRIEDSGGDELIVLDSVGNLQSGKPGFVSGLTGWQITPTGNAEFNNIWARGELHATVFVKDEVHATGGTFMVATAATFYEDATISDANLDEDELWVISTAADGSGPLEVVTTSPTFEGNTLWVSGVVNEIKLNHPPSGPAIYFQPGEILRVKTEVNEEGNPLRLADIWLVVNYATVEEDYGLYSVQKVSGSNATIPKGTAIVTYGKPGDGAILMTSDWRPASNDEGYAPYIDIFTTGQQPWLADDEGITPHVRLGQLKGVGLPGLSGINKFGMVAGSDLANANSSYMVASQDGVEIYRGVIRLNNGANDTGLWDADGNLRLGTNISQAATTGFRVITTAGAPYNVAGDEPGDVVIGDPTKANFLKWDHSAGTLTVSGALQVAGAVEAATQTWVTQQDDIYRGYAEQYTDDQVALIEIDGSAYADSRRIQSIDAVFNSTAYNIISWAAFSVFLANSTTRPVSANTSYTLNASFSRFWMYVNLGAADPLTLQFATSASAVNQPSYVLLGVVTKGATTPAQSRASVTVVAGSTYISGANIFTGSITAASIAASAITTDKIAALNVTADRIATDVFTTIDGQRIQRVEGVIVPTPPGGTKNQIIWSNSPTNILKVTRANGTTVTVVVGSRVVADRMYAYVLEGSTDVTNYVLAWYRPGFAPALPANAIIVAVCQAGATAASVTMTAGGVVISGNDIVAGSITADRIEANSIGAGQISADLYTTYRDDITTYTEGRRVLAVNGTFTSLGPSKISWSGVKVLQADGSASITINDSSINYPTGYTLTVARTYLIIPPNPSSPTNLFAYTNIESLPAGAITIAVCDTGAEAATIVQTGGGVVISGDDIVADSIVATKIVGNSITAAQINNSFYATIPAQISGDIGDISKDAMAAITVVSVGNKIATVAATIGRFTWPTMSVKFADDSYWFVPANSTGYTIVSASAGARVYFYIDTAEAVDSPMRATEAITAVPPTAIILGVGERGTTHSSVTMTYGGVIISGNHITAGSITANQIVVNQLDAFDTTTATLTTGALTINGNLTMNASGKIFSTGKTSPTVYPAGGGFFLGYDSASPAGYKVFVGEAADSMRWTPGNGLLLESSQPMLLTSSGDTDTAPEDVISTKVFQFERVNANVNQRVLSLWHAKTGIRANGDWQFLAKVDAAKLTVTLPPAVNEVMHFYDNSGSVQDDTLIYNIDGSGRLDYSGPGGMKLTGGLWTLGTIRIGGNLLTIETATNTITNSTNPGSAGNIAWGGTDPYYLYIHVGAGGWRRLPLGGTFA